MCFILCWHAFAVYQQLFKYIIYGWSMLQAGAVPWICKWGVQLCTKKVDDLFTLPIVYFWCTPLYWFHKGTCPPSPSCAAQGCKVNNLLKCSSLLSEMLKNCACHLSATTNSSVHNPVHMYLKFAIHVHDQCFANDLPITPPHAPLSSIHAAAGDEWWVWWHLAIYRIVTLAACRQMVYSTELDWNKYFMSSDCSALLARAVSTYGE